MQLTASPVPGRNTHADWSWCHLEWGPIRSPRGSPRLWDLSAVGQAEGEIVATARGNCEGWLLEEPRGSGGFGYDPYFVPERGGGTMAELKAAQKDAISHRGQALRSFIPLLRLHLCLEEEPSG